jgi:hypothetical protein
MTAAGTYRYLLNQINQSASGNISLRDFQDMYNREQVMYQKLLLDSGGNQSFMADTSLSPFYVELMVQLTNGRGSYNPAGNLAFGPKASITGYSNPDCGEDGVQTSRLIPVERVVPLEWDDLMNDPIDGPSLEYPKMRVLDKSMIEVAPKSIRFVSTWHVRFPRAIVVGAQVVSGIDEPDDNDPLQVDPEWDDADNIEIAWWVIAASGLKLQSDRLQATAARREAAWAR